MVAVLICSHTPGGHAARAIAAPTTRVLFTRELLIARRFASVYRQLTLRPARLMTTSAPSICSAHAPRCSASQATVRHGIRCGERLSATTSWPSK
jgi:hypothetical protein